MKNINVIYLAGFLFSFPIALAAYINSSFLASFTGEKIVGIGYTLGSIVSIICLSLAPKLWRKLGGYTFLSLVALLDIATFATLAYTTHAEVAIPAFVIGIALNTLIIFSLDEFIELSADNAITGRVRGKYLTIASFAWILAQLSIGTIFQNLNFQMLYLVCGVVLTTFLLLVIIYFRNIQTFEYKKPNVWHLLGEFTTHKNLVRACKINFLLQFFFAWMVIYTPIYLGAHLGFTWAEIGKIFTVMLLPFILIPLPLGKYSDKVGERTMLMLGFLVTSIATILIFFIKVHSILVWMVILFLTRVGASTVETMSDVYFFKHIDPKNEEYVSIYRSVSPVAYITAPIVALFVLIYVPAFEYLYLILGLIMLSGIYLASRISKRDI